MGEEDKADRGRGGKTTSGNWQAWSLAGPRGQWRTGKNGENWWDRWWWWFLCRSNFKSLSTITPWSLSARVHSRLQLSAIHKLFKYFGLFFPMGRTLQLSLLNLICQSSLSTAPTDLHCSLAISRFSLIELRSDCFELLPCTKPGSKGSLLVQQRSLLSRLFCLMK